MSKHPLQIAIESAGFEVQRYSGRGMFGKYCLGAYLPQGRSVAGFQDDIREALRSTPAADRKTARAALKGLKNDALGRGTIVYFPAVVLLAECRACRGYGNIDDNGEPTIDRRCRKCTSCSGEGKVAL